MSTAVTATTTISSMPNKNLHVPFNDKTISRNMGFIGRIADEQQAAASGTVKHIARHSGRLQRITIGTSTATAAGESMTYDVQVNGTSVFSSTPQVAAATAAGLYDVTALTNAGTQVPVGAVISVIRTYVAGGGPTLVENDIVVEWGGNTN
jgi:hypothetical protein